MILTEHALEYEQEMREWLARLYTLRSRLRSEARQGPKAIITTQHTLTVSYLPRLLRYFRHNSPDAGLQVKSLDRSECLQLFDHGQADLLLCSELQGAPVLREIAASIASRWGWSACCRCVRQIPWVAPCTCHAVINACP